MNKWVAIKIDQDKATDVMNLLGSLNFYDVGAIVSKSELFKDPDEDTIERVAASSRKVFRLLYTELERIKE